jgi:hypothetical protein
VNQVAAWRARVAAHAITADAVLLSSLEGVQSENPRHRGVRGIYFAENWEDPEGFQPYVCIGVTDDDVAAWRDAVVVARRPSLDLCSGPLRRGRGGGRSRSGPERRAQAIRPGGLDGERAIPRFRPGVARCDLDFARYASTNSITIVLVLVVISISLATRALSRS